MTRVIHKNNLNLEAKFSAFPYQVQAFDALKDLDYAAIFHEQGLGKTKIAIDLLLYWLQKRDIDTVLIVSKKQLIRNWEYELAAHTFIIPKVLTSDRKENYYVLNSAGRVIITNFETLSTEQERIRLFLKTRNVAIIIDESVKIKNPDSKLTKTYFDLSSLFKIRVIMTGTPVANRPYDIWAQVYFLDQGKSLGADFSEFKRNADLSNDLADDSASREIFENYISSIFEQISSFTVRETKASTGIDLPQKTYLSMYADWEEKQRDVYKKVLDEMELEIQRGGQVFIDDESIALKRLIRLLEITSNPALVDERYSRTSGKERMLRSLLDSILATGDKCIVWSSFIENIDYFTKKFAAFSPRKIHGRMSIEERNHSVDVFKFSEDCRLLFATPQAAKEGLTLTVANRVVFYDRGFNLDDYLQAQDRIHRISQTRHCYIYNLMINDSIDIWVDKLLQAKQFAAFLTQGDISLSEYRANANYSYSRIIKEILHINN